jgi:hypothetical protein
MIKTSERFKLKELSMKHLFGRTNDISFMDAHHGKMNIFVIEEEEEEEEKGIRNFVLSVFNKRKSNVWMDGLR